MAWRDLVPAIALGVILALPLTIGHPAAAADEVLILSRYRSYTGANMLPRRYGHPAVDFAAQAGDPVLAAADGVVSDIIASPAGCGNGVVIEHQGFDRWTVYCHLQAVAVEPGQVVSRGEPIGEAGRSGSTNNVPHVHLELCTSPCLSHTDGDFEGTEDPLAIAAGCYEPNRRYPTDRLVITFPVSCRYWARWR
jgi:murein DD-endopeptidase MepM/ murein hydrolase activator NlpD